MTMKVVYACLQYADQACLLPGLPDMGLAYTQLFAFPKHPPKRIVEQVSGAAHIVYPVYPPCR